MRASVLGILLMAWSSSLMDGRELAGTMGRRILGGDNVLAKCVQLLVQPVYEELMGKPSHKEKSGASSAFVNTIP